MRTKHCFVPNCKSNSEREPNVSFHCFPSNPRILLQWAKNMDMEETLLKHPKSTQKHYLVCGKHFIDSCFQTAEKKKLNRGAVPTMFPSKASPSIIQNIKFEDLKTSGSPVILNHQITFPDAFANTEYPVQSILPTSIQVPVVANIDYVLANMFQIPQEMSATDLDDHCKDPPKKRLFKYKTNPVHIKIPKYKIHRELTKAKTLISILKKAQPNCLNLFNQRRHIFNNSILRNLSKLDRAPPAVKTYINHQIKKLATKQWAPRIYNNDETSFYAALYKSNKIAYQHLRKMKIFHLPSRQSLNHSLENIHLQPGINDILFDELRRCSLQRTSLERQCALLFKVVELCPNLSYNKRCDTIDGLEYVAGKRTQNIVSRALVFMLCGVHASWKQPIAYSFLSNCAIDDCVREIIAKLHTRTEFVVVATVSTRNIAANYGREIVHVFDPSHLLRSLRNCFMNNNIVYDDDCVAKWSDIVKLHNGDKNNILKLSSGHIHPTPTQKKKTLLAAQVFSQNVYKYLTKLTNAKLMDAFDTADFCLFVNKLYDSLTKNPQHEFLNNAELKLRSLIFVNNSTGKKIRQPFVVDAFVQTIQNVQKLWLKLETNKSSLKLNLDPLENFYEAMKNVLEQNTRPTSLQFQEAFKICLIMNNCDEDGTSFLFLLNPELACVSQRISLSNTELYTNEIYVMVKNIKFYSSEYIAGFLGRQMLRHGCSTCVEHFTIDSCSNINSSVRIKDGDTLKLMSATPDVIPQIGVVQREVYKKIPECLHKERFIELLYHYAEQHWSFDFGCPKHRYEMKFKTIMSICFIMVKYFIEMTNKMLRERCKKKPTRKLSEVK